MVLLDMEEYTLLAVRFVFQSTYCIREHGVEGLKAYLMRFRGASAESGICAPSGLVHPRERIKKRASIPRSPLSSPSVNNIAEHMNGLEWGELIWVTLSLRHVATWHRISYGAPRCLSTWDSAPEAAPPWLPRMMGQVGCSENPISTTYARFSERTSQYQVLLEHNIDAGVPPPPFGYLCIHSRCSRPTHGIRKS